VPVARAVLPPSGRVREAKLAGGPRRRRAGGGPPL